MDDTVMQILSDAGITIEPRGTKWAFVCPDGVALIAKSKESAIKNALLYAKFHGGQ